MEVKIARKISSKLSSIKQEFPSEPRLDTKDSQVQGLNVSSSELESEESLIDTNFSKHKKERLTLADKVQEQDLMLEL